MTFSILAAGASGAAHGGAVPAWAMLAYLASGVFFILALRGLSSPATSQAGNRNGMIGMGLAVATTLVTHNIANILEIAIAIAIGGTIGVVVARRIAMTAMPELVAGFHSLVGLAAVVVGFAAWLNPEAFGITDAAGQIMAVTNAISSVIVVGAIVAAAEATSPVAKYLGLFGVVLASINIFGGFAVTQRMLAMYKKKEK